MSGFEDFLSAQAAPQAGNATQAPPAALAPPDGFESFLSKVKGEQDEATLQTAQAASIANAHSGITADQAGQAAQIGKQVGLPQAAVETDPQRYQAQAKAQANSATLQANPVLAKWVAANPDSARIAQDEYDKLGAVEKLWTSTKDTSYAFLQQLGGSFNSAALGLNRVIAGPLALSPSAHEWWVNNMINPRIEAGKNLELSQDASLGQKAAGTVGSLIGLLSQVSLTGGGNGASLSNAAGVVETVANAAQNAVRSMAFPSLTASANTAADIYEKTGDIAAASRAAMASYGFTTLQGAVPFSVSGGLAKRVASGAVSGVATSEGQRAAMNLVLPDAMHQNFNPDEAIFQALTGAVLGGVMGPRSDPHLYEGVRQTYTDGLKAEQAERDIGKVAALSEIAAKSKLRENDPDAFHEFVRTVTDKTSLDAVYVNGAKLSEAFAQSKIEPPAEIARQLQEAVATGGDVRIPIADYATHLAGTDIEKTILPEMKAAPDGMTMAEGQAFYQNATKTMSAKAEQMAKEKQERTDLEEDQKQVYQTVLEGLTATKRYPDAVSKVHATLAAEFYSTMAAREGVKPTEMFKRSPLNFTAEAVDGLNQGKNEAITTKFTTESVKRGDTEQQLLDITHPKGEKDTTVRAMIDGKEVGHLDLSVSEDGKTAEVREVKVGADYRRQGVATALYDAAKEHGYDVRSSFQTEEGAAFDAAMNGKVTEHSMRFAQGERGAFNPQSRTISLLQGADLSTTVHELGHAFLDTLSHIAVDAKASEGVKSDFNTLLKWFGVKDAAAWHALTLEQQRPHHEKLAKSFEQYLMEGKAPNPQLQTVFGRIRSWMLNVYKNVANIGADLNPEVRGVFDRLLATDAAIKQSEQMRAYAPLFENAKAAGMSAADFNAYIEQGKQATEHAMDQMQVRSMRDMQWLSNAKSRALKSLQKQASAARKEVAAEVENEVKEMPVFKAKEEMRTKDANADIVANANGFQDGDAMRQAIHDAGSMKDVISILTDQRMLQRHGELTDPQAVEQAANEAVHNEARARFMATGLKALTDSPLPANQIAKAAKEAAEGIIAGKAVGELRPDQYLAAEARANKDALASAAKDPAKAIEAQRAALLNNRLAKAAMDAQAEVQKGLEYLKKFDKPTVAKGVGADYMDRINELLAQYDITKRFDTKSDVEARASMRDWLQSEFASTGLMPEVSERMLDFARRQHWKELSVEDFRGLVDAAKSLEHVGREQMLVTVAGKKIELADLVDRAKVDMATLPHSDPIDIQPHMLHAKGLDKISARWLASKQWLRDKDSGLIKMEQLFQWLTYGDKAGLGQTRSGPFLEMFQRAGDAEGVERQLRADSSKELRALGESLRDAKVNLNDSLTVPLTRKGRGIQWYREELISAALNTGNEGNLKKMLEGYGWTERQLMDALNTHLTAAEWKFVQGVWNAIGKYGPQISELQRRMTGVSPEMVKARTVHTAHGALDGGYYPVVYDAFLDQKIDTHQAQKADMLFENQWAKPTTSKGHTVERTGYVGPIQLSLGVIPRHIDQVTHDLAWREAIIDINKFLAHPEINSEVDQTMGREYRKQFRPWLQAMANDKVFNTAGDSAWESFYRKVRTNTTMVGLGFRLSTMLIHGSSAMSNSIGEVGTKWFAKGAAQFATPERWEQSKQFMFERSPEMANRFNEHDRNVNEAIREINDHARALGPISATQRAVDGARRFAFYGVSALDMGSAAPTWMGAYMKGLEAQPKGGLGMSEEAAIDYANRAVRNAHGGGGVKDLSAVQRDKGVMSLATMFYSFWNHMYNRQRDLAKGYGNLPDSFKQGTGTKDFAKLLARSWWYFVIPQLIHAALKPTPPSQQSEGEDDIGAMAAHMGEEIGLGFVSGVPVLRDLANAAINGRDYTITPLEQAGKSVVKASVDTYKLATGQDVSAHAGKNAAQAVGYVAGLPTGQLSATGSFLWDVYNGDADPEGIKDWYTGIQNGRISQ